MRIIKEVKIGKESLYHVTEKLGGDTIYSGVVTLSTAIVQYKGASKYLVYNSLSEVVENTYDFLNKSAKYRASNTRRNYMYALKYLYAFLEIFDKNVHELNDNDLHKLNAFLKGFSASGDDYEFNLLTRRSSKSVAIYFSAYKEYFKYLGVKNSPLLVEHKSNYVYRRNRFIEKSHVRKVVPEYINEHEYSRIMSLLEDEDDIITLRNKCMIRLMYEAGLRIGELLGLTLEDIEPRKISNGKFSCVILVRNRLSSKNYQQAKTCMKIYDKRNYNSNDYRTRNVGYQEAIIFDFDGISTYDLLCKYIDEAHEDAEKNHAKRYKSTTADSVGNFAVTKRTNRYIFLNTRGGVLSDEIWNRCLRKIFKEVDIHVDVGYRKHNLSHRFRHGFAMKIMYGIGSVSTSAVKTFTRHKSDEGLNAYNNPTTEDIVKMKEELVNEIGVIDLLVNGGDYDK